MNVRVNDSYTWTLTDETGFYSLSTRSEYVAVRIVIPSAFWPTSADGWFRGIDFTQQQTAQVDFALQQKAWPAQVTWYQIADTHVWYDWDTSQVKDALRADFQAVAAENPAPAFVVVNGDTHYTAQGFVGEYRNLVAPLTTKNIGVFTITGDSERDYEYTKIGSGCVKEKHGPYCRFMKETSPLAFSHDVAGYHLIFTPGTDASINTVGGWQLAGWRRIFPLYPKISP